jgi:hypothetical protein
LDRRHWREEVAKIDKVLVTDSRSLFDFVNKRGSTPSDKRLRLDLEMIRDEIDDEGLRVRWVKSGQQLADALTKGGLEASLYLRLVLATTRYSLVDDERLPEKVAEWKRDTVADRFLRRLEEKKRKHQSKGTRGDEKMIHEEAAKDKDVDFYSADEGRDDPMQIESWVDIAKTNPVLESELDDPMLVGTVTQAALAVGLAVYCCATGCSKCCGKQQGKGPSGAKPKKDMPKQVVQQQAAVASTGVAAVGEDTVLVPNPLVKPTPRMGMKAERRVAKVEVDHCKHPSEALSEKGSNQYGLRLTCMACGTVVRVNTKAK